MSAKRRQRPKKSTAKPKSTQPQPRRSLDLAQFAETSKTPTSVAPTRAKNAASRSTAAREADVRQARFVAGVAALAFAVGVVFFFAGQTSRRLAPPSKPEGATIPTPQKLADAVAAEVEKARSEAVRRRAVVETSVRDVSALDATPESADSAAVASASTDVAPVPNVDAAVKNAPSAETLSFVVDLNAASKAELTNLPRVGATLAERIIERREELGGFRSVDDLLGVKGIGEKTLDRMRPFCVVAPLDETE